METVDVDIILKKTSRQNGNEIITACEYFLRSNKLTPGTVVSHFSKDNHLLLYDTIAHIIIGNSTIYENNYVDFSQVKIKWYMYALNREENQMESECDEDGSEVVLAKIQILPSSKYFNLWETLVYDTSIKENLLKYASTAMLYADKGIDTNIISCNRVVLLHGPPGTGKTSLCKALAHKLSVRMNNRFKRGILMEINSHSLFSKWFSESGKLVTKMFTKVWEYLADQETIIFLLIDEIESLAHAREKCMSGVEPSDSIRVVNAVLTQIDLIKNNSNVLILTTSNMTGAIDLAFVDRADIKQYIGMPGANAIYQVYYSCFEELFKAGIIQPKIVMLPTYRCQLEDVACYETTLYELSVRSIGFSGRTLRKIPFLAHSLLINKEAVKIEEFLDAMTKAIEIQKNDRIKFKN